MMRWFSCLILLLGLFSFRNENQKRIVTDSRDGKSYRISLIGNTYWYCDELDYVPDTAKIASKHLVINESGVYYSNFISHQVCPKGWSLPTKYNWSKYFNQLDLEHRKKARIKRNGLKYKNKKKNLLADNLIDLKPTGRIDKGKFSIYALADLWVKDSVNQLAHTHITTNDARIHSHTEGLFIDSMPMRLFKIKCVCEAGQ